MFLSFINSPVCFVYPVTDLTLKIWTLHCLSHYWCRLIISALHTHTPTHRNTHTPCTNPGVIFSRLWLSYPSICSIYNRSAAQSLQAAEEQSSVFTVFMIARVVCAHGWHNVALISLKKQTVYPHTVLCMCCFITALVFVVGNSVSPVDKADRE